MNGALSALELGPRGLRCRVVLVVLILAGSVLSSGCCGAQTTDPEPPDSPAIWSAPPPPTVLIEDTNHLLFETVEAIEQGDCVSVISASEELMDRARSEVGDAFHSQSTDQSSPVGWEMRAVLDRFLYAQPAVIEVSPAGFRFPSWWMHHYAFCLVEDDRLEDAALQYLLMAIDGSEPEAHWRLALVYSWLGRMNEALSILENWSFVDRPPGFDRVLDAVLSGEPMPRYTQPGQTEVD